MKISRKRPSTVDRPPWNSQSALHIILQLMLSRGCMSEIRLKLLANCKRKQNNHSNDMWNISIFMCIVFERELNSFNEYFNIFEHILWYHKLVRRIRGRILYRNWLLLGISFACLKNSVKTRPWMSSKSYLLERAICNSARFCSRAVHASRCWARIPSMFTLSVIINEQIFSCLLPIAVMHQGHKGGSSLLPTANYYKQVIVYVKIIPIISLLDGQKLVSFFFDIFENFFNLFDDFIQCCMHLLTSRITLSL